MKVIVDIEDSKFSFVMELLNSLSFVKAKPISDTKADAIGNIKKGVEELNLIKQGKLKGIPARDLLNEI